MRNVRLSILVIVITIFTVITMSMDFEFLSKRKSTEKTDDITQTIPHEASKEKDPLDKQEAQPEEKEEPIKQEQEKEPNQQGEQEGERKAIQDSESDNSEEDQKKENKTPLEKPGRTTEEDEETAQVFKIDKTTIADKLSFEEKRKLLSIASKLSMIDYANIVDTMQSSEEMKSASHIFGILKLRLESEDYKQLVEILDPYLYIDNIESNISS